jgi:hypothetical protein
MKKALRFKLLSLDLLLFVLILFGCKNTPENLSADFKMTGRYDINFLSAQKTLTHESTNDFKKSLKVDIKRADIKKNKMAKVSQKIDNITELEVSIHKDTIKRFYQIKSTIVIDTVISQGVKNTIGHMMKGHTEHEILVIANKNDTLKRFATTTFNVKMDGTIKGKSNDLVIDYLIEKYYLVDYIDDILKAIKEGK